MEKSYFKVALIFLLPSFFFLPRPALADLPQAPQNLSASEGRIDDVLVSWSNTQTSGQIQVFFNGDCSGTNYAVVPGTSWFYYDLAAIPGITYTYSARRFIVNGIPIFGPCSNSDTGYRRLPAPTIHNAISNYGNGNYVHLSWVGLNPLLNAVTGYQVLRRLLGSTNYEQIATLGLVTTYDDSPPYPGVTYEYVVRAVAQNGTFSDDSGPASGQITFFPPSNLNVATNNLNHVHLSWTAPPRPSDQRFKVYRSTSYNQRDCRQLLADNVNSTAYDDHPPPGSYYYSVRAYFVLNSTTYLSPCAIFDGPQIISTSSSSSNNSSSSSSSAGPTLSISGEITKDVDTGYPVYVSRYAPQVSACQVNNLGMGRYTYYCSQIPYGARVEVHISSLDASYSPPYRNYPNLTESLVNQSFSGLVRRYTISGAILNGSVLSGAPTGVNCPISEGFYQCAEIPYGSTFTLTPTQAGYSFTPPSRFFFALNQNLVNQDFTATLLSSSSSSSNSSSNFTSAASSSSSSSSTAMSYFSSSSSYSVPPNGPSSTNGASRSDDFADQGCQTLDLSAEVNSLQKEIEHTQNVINKYIGKLRRVALAGVGTAKRKLINKWRYQAKKQLANAISGVIAAGNEFPAQVLLCPQSLLCTTLDASHRIISFQAGLSNLQSINKKSFNQLQRLAPSSRLLAKKIRRFKSALAQLAVKLNQKARQFPAIESHCT